MLKLNRSVLAGLAVTSLLYAGSGVWADGDRNQFRARLIGFEEIPAVSSTGRGQFRARIISISGSPAIEWELTYQGLEGGATSAAHVHFGQKGVIGGVSFFLCGAPRPACTNVSGSFSGTATAADIVGPNAQGIEPGSIAEVIRAMRAGITYANVHTTPRWPGGEIRGQIRGGDDDDD